MIKNLKAYKTSILGIVLLASTGYFIVKGIPVNDYILSGLIVSGILLLLSPDTYANLLEGFVRQFFDKKD